MFFCRTWMEMENRHTWMQRSLKQTAKLGLNVLERAKRREVDWSSLCSGGGQIHREQQSMENPEQEEGDHVSLEEAFATMANFMLQTTEQCEKYHSCLPASKMSPHEVEHTCKFHCKKSMQTLLNRGSKRGVATGHLQPASKQRTSQDVRIEVAPGTYSISAGSCHSQRQTHVVNITPGQSVDLTFNL
ncbi:hypothetical protein FKM82_003209 [Ascaphus truei]